MVGNEEQQPRMARRQQFIRSWLQWSGKQAFPCNPLVSYHLFPLFGYLLLTILYTWPAAPSFFTHIPGVGDAPWFLWQFWWFKHALLDLQQSPYVTNLIYYPLTDVPVMAQTPVNELFSLPLQVAFNVVILNNLLFFSTYLLSGYFTYLLGVALTRRRVVAFIGGLIFAFCAYRGIRSLGHMSLLTTQWMPLALLLTIQCGRHPSWSRGVAAGVAAGLVVLSSPYYVGFFLFPVGLAGAVYLVLWERPRLWQKRLWLATLAGCFTFLALTIPPYLHYTQLEPEVYNVNQALQSTTTLYSADLLSWWLPSAWHPLWRTFTAPIYAGFTTPNLTETTLFVGYIPLLLLLLSFGLKHKPTALRFWQMLAVGSWLLSLGPVLHFNGKPLFAWMPYHFLEMLPGFNNFRAPSRIGITTALALSVVAMLVLHNLMTRYRQASWPAILGIGGLLIFANELVVLPFPQTDIRPPAIYETVAAAPGAGAVLELPAGEYFQRNYNYLSEVGQAMYYQSYHHKPIVSGYLGRRPQRLSEPEKSLPFVRHFFQDRAQPPQAGFATRALLPEPFRPEELEQAPWLLQYLGIEYVVLRRPLLQHRFFTEAAPLLNQALGLPIQVDGDFRLHQVAPPPYHLYDAPLSPLIAPMPTYDETFSPLFRDAFGAATRTVVTDKLKDGVIRFTLPMTGVWALQGEWVGAAANAAQLALNGVPLDLRRDAYDGMVVAWATTIPSGPGDQVLTLSLPPTNQAASDGPCATLCLRDFAVRLVQPTIPSAPLATFVNASNQEAALLGASLLTTAEGTAPALQTAWLATLWRLDAGTFAQVQTDPQALPSLYMHLTTTDGQTQAQVDHRLGQRRLVLADAPVLFDLVPLTTAPDDWTTWEVRLGLWYPATNSYFWATEPSRVDADNRFNLGVLAQYRQSVAAPALAIDDQLETVFAQPYGAERYTLLQAHILSATNDTEPSTLLTTWRIPYHDTVEDQIKLRLSITDAKGAMITQVEHRLGVDNLLNLATPYMIDRTTLPGLAQPVADLLFWVDLMHTGTNQPLSIIASARPDTAERVRLGAWRELVAPATP
jgi:hypothetical protein